MPSFNPMKKIDTRRLHNADMKKLVLILRDVSPTTKTLIKALPHRLRHSPLSSSGTLCTTHRGIDHHLIADIQSWVTHEFNSTIGRYVYPVIMSRKLTPAQERQIRQLEPVMRMWRKDFKAEMSAPPGRTPIEVDEKWGYQTNGCPACVLARIGADDDVLRALYAGMLARFHTSKLVSGKVSLRDLSVAKLDHPKSKRVRFVRYWLKASNGGDALLFEAAELGLAIKALHRQWKDEQRAGCASMYGGMVSLGGTMVRDSWGAGTDTANTSSPTASPTRVTTHPERHMQPSAQTVSVTSSAHIPVDTTVRRPPSTNSKIGPRPRPSNVHPHTPLSDLGFGLPGSSSRSDVSTLGPDDSVSVTVAPLRIRKNVGARDTVIANYPPRRDSSHEDAERVYGHTPRETLRHSSRAVPPSSSSRHPPRSTSLASTVTISSYDGNRTPRAQDQARSALQTGIPVPQRQSMYFGYADAGQVDLFEGVDEDVVDEEGEGEQEDMSVQTNWEDLY
jgi:hypothetical protein